MSWPYRCSRDGCRQRTALRRPIERYRQTPCCPACGHDSLRLDRWKQRDHRRALCRCGVGHWYPHRRGSLGCAHYTGPRTPAGQVWDHIAQALDAIDTTHNAPRAPF